LYFRLFRLVLVKWRAGNQVPVQGYTDGFLKQDNAYVCRARLHSAFYPQVKFKGFDKGQIQLAQGNTFTNSPPRFNVPQPFIGF
jgi:hypothetical protein